MYNITLDFQHNEDPIEKIFDDENSFSKQTQDEEDDSGDDEDDDDTDYVILPSNDEGLT